MYTKEDFLDEMRSSLSVAFQKFLVGHIAQVGFPEGSEEGTREMIKDFVLIDFKTVMADVLDSEYHEVILEKIIDRVIDRVYELHQAAVEPGEGNRCAHCGYLDLTKA